MHIILTRHGETKYNKKDKLQGQFDSELSWKGKRQAKRLAKRLEKEKIDVIYCSDLIRCKDTIKPFLKKHKNIPIIYTKEIRERSFGVFEKRKKEELISWIKEQKEKYPKKEDYSHRPKNGESFLDVMKRGKKFLNEIMKKEKGKNVLIVSHGGTNIALKLNIFNKNPAKKYKDFRMDNASISIIEVKDKGNHKAKVLNSTKHL